ncbi:MAG: hypothetical protein AMXMBFR56_49900 [Polyangiaceae bacterium]
MKRWVLLLVMVCGSGVGCGGDDDGSGSAGASTGGAGGSGGATGGAAGSGGSAGGSGGATGGTAGAGGATGGAAGSGGATGGAGGVTGGAGGASGGSGGQSGCNTVVLLGSAVPEVAGTGSPPSAQGGNIVDGTYVLTKWEVYGAAPGSMMRQVTSKVAGGKVEVALKQPTEQHVNYDLTIQGTTLSAKETCPGSNQVSFAFTATATGLMEIFASGAKTEVATYAKQ